MNINSGGIFYYGASLLTIDPSTAGSSLNLNNGTISSEGSLNLNVTGESFGDVPTGTSGYSYTQGRGQNGACLTI